MTNFFELLFASALLILSLSLSKTGTWSLPTTSTSSNEIHSSFFPSSSEEKERTSSSGENEDNSYPSRNPPFRDEHNFIEGDSSVCASHQDCSSNYCCTVGMMRYSIPTCLPMGQLGDACIPENSPSNFTLSYPNGEQLTAIDSFRLLCPCASGYFCDEDSVACVEKSKRKGAPGVRRQTSTTTAATTITTTATSTTARTTPSHENHPHPNPVLMKQSESEAKDWVLKKH